jgi:hypothetical protein
VSQTLSISDETYRILSTLASELGQSPEAFVETLIAEAQAEATRDPYTDSRYQIFEEFFRALGMTPEEIRQARENAKAGDADLSKSASCP